MFLFKKNTIIGGIANMRFDKNEKKKIIELKKNESEPSRIGIWIQKAYFTKIKNTKFLHTHILIDA